METTDSTSTPSSRLVLRQRLVLSLIVAMLFITLGAQVEPFLSDARGLLSLAWPMVMLLLAIYGLRIFLAGWMRRVMPGSDE